ncbi:MAG: CDP-alcohol phosphatidyltransferase family protein [Coriobacteriales bacterium]|nr:CDP-alcohol phosphatidyltransferase family protein [Coriobacteriales bacterium]
MRQTVTERVFTIPNFLSLIRLFLLPVFFVLLVQYENNVMAFIVLLVASLTDLIDGSVARATHTVSKLGQMLDPFVDRIFIIVSVIAVFVAGRVPLWILLLLLGRDACMFVLTIYQKRRYGRDFEVIFIGKLTTALIMAGFCSLVLWWPLVPGANIADLSFLPGWGSAATPLGTWLLYLGCLTSLIAGGIYLYRGTRPHPSDKNASTHESRRDTPARLSQDAKKTQPAGGESKGSDKGENVQP